MGNCVHRCRIQSTVQGRAGFGRRLSIVKAREGKKKYEKRRKKRKMNWKGRLNVKMQDRKQGHQEGVWQR